MTSRSPAVAALVLAALLVGGCSQSASAPVPLTAGECKEMKDKQLQLMLGALPAGYQKGLEDAKIEVKLDCDTLDPKVARMQYECTMASDSMAGFDQCQVEKSRP